MFLWKDNKFDNSLARLMKNKREKKDSNKIRKGGDITTNFTEVKRIIREYYKQLYVNKLEIYIKWTNSYKHKPQTDSRRKRKSVDVK